MAAGRLRRRSRATSRRTIPLPATRPPGARDATDPAGRRKAAAGTAWQDRDGLVFTDGVGSPLRPEGVVPRLRARPAARPACRAVRFHDLRHCAATTHAGRGRAAGGHQRVARATPASRSPTTHYAAVVPELRTRGRGRDGPGARRVRLRAWVFWTIPANADIAELGLDPKRARRVEWEGWALGKRWAGYSLEVIGVPIDAASASASGRRVRLSGEDNVESMDVRRMRVTRRGRPRPARVVLDPGGRRAEFRAPRARGRGGH